MCKYEIRENSIQCMCANISIIIFKNQELQREQCEQLLSSNSIRLYKIHFSDVIFERGQRGSLFPVTRNRAPYFLAHVPERVLSKADCTVLNLGILKS